MKKINTLLGAVLAGIAIGIGGAIYLTLENKIIGALMFTVGLYTICCNGLFLFTGKVGYLVEQKKEYLLDLAIIWFGNLIGTGLAGFGFNITRIKKISETARTICEIKVNDSFISLFVLGIFCGLLMFVAVDGYKNSKNPLILFVCVSVFILCGFEHCIADMFYFSVGNCWTVKSIIVILVITLGNSIGGILIPLWNKTK